MELINKQAGKPAVKQYRWIILSLVFFATTINYLDRQVISLLKDDYLEPLFGWNETDYTKYELEETDWTDIHGIPLFKKSRRQQS